MTESTNPPDILKKKALESVIKKANAGDQNALRLLRKFLDLQPQIWNEVGDVAKIAEKAWITLITNGDSLIQESLQKKLAVLNQEILGDSDHIFGQMLADVIRATWLETHYLMSIDADATNRTACQSTLMIKRLESAQRRYTSAIKQYCQIKKLLPIEHRKPDLRIFRPQQERA
ncbi:MAG TPA: hypothetical protein DCM07_22450 [Planctomycetaceae bacterium]|uniref:hypothetical protein n=1 Tax=Gimesia sp. TaxID=2024833 RepID=UPI000C3584C8|nr:hypothetical protein [Gimesia sp.]MAX36403.1 hypothetical protein [Gimesia sp.]HAH47570.1 hypothetical protein [Planctomycetaceae bacterium]HBL46593.1 hypothetical protein [Planctomycetaceae bacterium]